MAMAMSCPMNEGTVTVLGPVLTYTVTCWPSVRSSPAAGSVEMTISLWTVSEFWLWKSNFRFRFSSCNWMRACRYSWSVTFGMGTFSSSAAT